MFCLAWKVRHGCVIPVQHGGVVRPDNEKGWRMHAAEGRASKVRPAPSRDYGAYDIRTLRSGNQCSRCASASSEITEPQTLEVGLPTDPVGNLRNTVAEQK